MTAPPGIAARVQDAVSASLLACDGDRGAGRGAGVLLAVSGGRDSMVLLHAAGESAPGRVRGVATFDHGTGPYATAAVALVHAEARALGLDVVRGRAASAARTEAGWRDARWAFLREQAAALGARGIATAHTAEDQLETVALRLLRGAGARGTAALAAPAVDVVRPLLAVSRAVVAEYAAVHGLHWVDDPSNVDRRHARVRLRSDLLPAISRVRPDAAGQLLAHAARAASWRTGTDAWAARLAAAGGAPVSALAGLDAEALAVFWPAFAARAGVRLDRRALARLVAFTARAARRLRDGTVQPARVPVAGAGRHVVELVYGADSSRADSYRADPGADRSERAGRAWQFVVRRGDEPGPRPHPNGSVGVAVPESSDYA